MLCGLGIRISDIDIYGKKLGLFYKTKEKISSYFGLALTLIYIFISLGIFIFYTIETINHEDLQVNDSTIYSKEVPNINLTDSDLLYFAFAVEEPNSAARFIDETIYTIKAIFYDGVKDKDGIFQMKELRELKVEKCNQEKFGKNYQYLFTNGEFNNSYCLSKLDFVLHGGFIYDRISLIRLDVYPCKNSSENNFHCQPQETIDNFLAGGYFSILLKDIGLNPGNYSSPILPTLQDLYTTISKQFFRDMILYYEITEVKTDSGIFFKNVNSKRYLKFDKMVETLFLRSDKLYYEAESICGVQIRLSDNIHVQNREYKKMNNVFATAGGYMQMLNTIFTLLSFLPNKFYYDHIIVDNLFDFDLKKNKIIAKNKKRPKKRYMSDLVNQTKEPIKLQSNLSLKLYNKDEYNHNELKSEKKESKSDIKDINKSNISGYEKGSNASKLNIFPFQKDFNNSNIFIEKNKYMQYKKMRRNFNNYEESSNFMQINLNIFDYLCLGKYRKSNKNFFLFRKGILIFKEKMDIVNIFNYIIFSEKYNEEKALKINI